jgi:tetratricopeptide (TPR) repeat protein
MGGLVVFGLLVGYIKAAEVQIAFRKRHYQLVHRKIKSAVRWNALWTPITAGPLRVSAGTYVNLLIAEGKTIELEALSRYQWTYKDGSKSSDNGLPANLAVANNLSVALLEQYRFDAAIDVLKKCLDRKDRGGKSRGYLLNNLALALIRANRIAEADVVMNDVIKENARDPNSPLGLRVPVLKAWLADAKSNWEEVVELIEGVFPRAIKSHETAEFQSNLYYLLGKAQRKLGRLDEAELNLRSSVELLESAPYPAWLRLAEHLAEYALLLKDQGKEKLAAEKMVRAHDCVELAEQTANATIERIRRRIEDKKHILISAELVEPDQNKFKSIGGTRPT